MSDVEDKPDCAVCREKTALRCSGCHQLPLCSREHQKLIWSTHKFLCGKDPEEFTYPPLTPEEANAYRQVSNISKSVNFPATTQKSLEKVREMDEEIEGFEDTAAYLSQPYEALASDINYLPRLLALRQSIFFALNEGIISLPSPPSPWTLVAALHHYFAKIGRSPTTNLTLPLPPDQLDFLQRKLNPFLRQVLIFFTLLPKMDEPNNFLGLAFHRAQVEGDKIPLFEDGKEEEWREGEEKTLVDELLEMMRDKAVKLVAEGNRKKGKVYSMFGQDINV